MTRLCLATLVLALLVGPGPAAAQPTAEWSHLTVVTVAGEVYEDVAVAWVGQGKAVQLTRPDGATRNLELAQIREITNAQGQQRLAEFVALRHAPGQQKAPPPRADADFTEIGASPLTLAATSKRRTRLLQWSFGVGAGYVSTFGGDFPGASNEFVFSSTIRRRIYNRSYLSLTGHAMHLADQLVAAWWDPSTQLLVTWEESQMFLSYGQYYRPRSLYWEAGLGVLERTLKTQGSSGEGSYLKGAVRLQLGWLVEISRHFALDVAVFTSFKPGFRDNRGGIATDLGLRGELVVW